MRDRVWWVSAVTQPSSCRSESGGLRAHRVARNGLQTARVHRERLQVRQRLLERKPLLVEVCARAPQLQGDLPSGLLAAADDRNDLLEPLPVVRLQDLDAGGCAGERPAV